MGLRPVQSCFIVLAVALPLADSADRFSCPPNTQFQGRAQRVDIGQDFFLPVLASTAPQKRNVVCEPEIAVVLRNVKSGQYLRDVNGGLRLSDVRGASFRLKSSGSFPGTVQLESTTSWQKRVSDAQGMVQLLPMTPGESQSWWLSESKSGHLQISSFLAGQLSVVDDYLEMAVKADAAAEWSITKENGDEACSLVEPSTAIITLPGNYLDTEQQHHDMGSVLHDFEQVKGSSLVLSMAFSNVPCAAEQWTPHQPGQGEAARWLKSSDWIIGANPDQDHGPSSIQSIDAVILWLAENYKGVKMVLVTGIGDAGALGLRWSMLSLVGVNGVYTKSDGIELQVRTVLGDLRIWEYLDASRPAPKCTVEEQTTPCHSCDKFMIPEPGSRRRGMQVPGACSKTYNTMPYGLDGLVGEDRIDKFSSLSKYVKLDFKNSAEFTEFDDKPFIEEYPLEVGMRLKSKDLRFVFDGKDSTPEDGPCEVLLQGTSLLQRALNYMGHLQALLGSMPIFGVYEAKGNVPHLGAWRSAFFQSWAFLERPGVALRRPGKGGKWVETSERHCSDGHGAQALLGVPEQCHTLASCQDRCFADSYCAGFVMHSDPADMQCWLFSEVKVGKCKVDADFQLWTLENSTTYFSSSTHFPMAAAEAPTTSLRTSTFTTITTTSPVLLYGAVVPVGNDTVLTSVRVICIAGIAAVILGLACLGGCCASGGGSRTTVEGQALIQSSPSKRVRSM